MLLDHSKLARDFVIHITNVCSFYNNHVPLTLQRNALAWLVAKVSCRHWDLGSIPRSPHTFHIFFLNVFLCSTSSKVHHARSHPGLPRAHEFQSKGYKRMSTIHASQPLHMQAQKVKKALHSWARFLTKNLLLGPDTPHGLHQFLIFICFSF